MGELFEDARQSRCTGGLAERDNWLAIDMRGFLVSWIDKWHALPAGYNWFRLLTFMLFGRRTGNCFRAYLG